MSEITDRAHQLLNGRVDAIEKLSDCQMAAIAARESADVADRAVASAWTEATQAGWMASELRKLGLVQPAAQKGGRPKGVKNRADRSAEQPASAQTDHHE